MLFRRSSNKDQQLGNLALRMTFAICIVVICLIAAEGVILGRYVYVQSQEVVEQYSIRAIDATINEIDYTVGLHQRLTDKLSLQEDYLTDTSECLDLFYEFLSINDEMSSISVVYVDDFFDDKKPHIIGVGRKNGIDSVIVTNSIYSYGDAIRDSNWYFAQRDSAWWSAGYLNPLLNQWQICYSRPLYRSSDSSLYGMLCAEISMDRLENFTTGIKPDSNVDLRVVHQNGFYVIGDSTSLPRNQKYNIHHKMTRLGWTALCSYPVESIKHYVWHVTFGVVDTIIITLLVTIVCVVVCVRIIALPYMDHIEEQAKEKAAIERDMQVSSRLQQRMLPPSRPPSPLPGVDLYARLATASDVGGDLYDYLFVDNRIVFCVGDVCGKGIPSALFMSEISGMFHTLAPLLLSPDKIVKQLNDTIASNNDQCMFCTLFVGCLNLDDDTLTFCNAGHNSPVVVKPDGCEWLSMEGDGIVGVFKDAVFHQETCHLVPGEGILLYTDGVTEAKDKAKNMYGEKRLLDTLNACRTRSSQETVDALLDDVMRHFGSEAQSDDITIMELRILDGE